MRPIAIIGTGGLGRVVADVVADINLSTPTWDLRCFLDDNPARHGERVHGVPITGGVGWLLEHRDVATVIAIGNPVTRRRIADDLQAEGFSNFATLIHPRAWVGQYTTIGPGSMICPGALIDPDVQIGAHAVLNTGVTIGHDGVFGDWVTVAPGAHLAGTLHVGAGCDFGIGSTVIQGLRIGHWSIVGAGATVVRDVPANTTVVGVPAQVIRERPDGWQDAMHTLKERAVNERR
ncbi:acetyltransferase [Chloroflexales bacterium ZM16-3]|nr:acetyltransferase [Chloroflexales bacterium ZM16-3]